MDKKVKEQPIEIGVTYNGVGNFIIGLPARDMEQTEWLTYSEGLRSIALISGLYSLKSQDVEVVAEAE
jgi:hypothetical protein